ncbi:MAG TPA: M48 family metalloprotease [Candidatus Sulfotelmatobacter sp.]|nr:M48 family metalloprotease [Candidatus Sulfotelmatobacter sp.]
MKSKWQYSILGLTLLIAVSALAQDYDKSDDDDDDPGLANLATLSLNFDGHGSLNLTLNLPQSATESAALPDILAQSFHCPSGVIKHPDFSQFDSSDLQKSWSAARRDRFRQQLEKYNSHILQARCEGVLSKDALAVRGEFDYSALVTALQGTGVERVDIALSAPKTAFFDYSREFSRPSPITDAGRSSYVEYEIPVKDAHTPATLHLSYGLRRSDVQRALAILAAFIFVPMLLTLWMRRRALAMSATDPAAAWFGFMRGLNWLVLAAMFIWLSADFGSRKVLLQWIDQQAFSPFKTALVSVSLSLFPAFLIYLGCMSLSYAVHTRLRGARWTRKEFLAQQLTTVGAQALPLMFLLSGLTILRQEPKTAAALMISALFVFQMLTLLKFRILKTFPQPLTTGDLRDRIFTMAGKLGVGVNQIYIVPASKGQVANAYAARNRIVMFTDYLLEHLNRREVDGVAAHELAHLRYKHPSKLGVALLAAIFLPQYFSWLVRTVMSLVTSLLSSLPDAGMRFSMHFWRVFGMFERWPERNLVLIMIGMACFYLLSRHFENVADATAVRLTGDAEAQITGILKVSRLGLVPIRWGKATETWVTHPSTFNRVQRMAKAGGLAAERLQQILSQYDAQAGTARVAPPEDRYQVPPSDPERVQIALNEQRRNQGKAWVLLSTILLPPALLSVTIPQLHLEGSFAFVLYAAGIVFTVTIAIVTSASLGRSSYEEEKKRIAQRFAHERIPAGRSGDPFVGFAPGPYPRRYGTRNQWDAGFLVFAKDGLKFVGEQVKFSFAPSEIKGVVISPGTPSWFRYQRIYLRWETADGRNGIFNLASHEPGSLWANRSRAQNLYQQVQNWRQQPSAYAPRPELTDLKSLELGQVTCTSPRELGSFQATLRVLLLLMPVSVVVSMLLHANTTYVLLSLLAVRLFESIPYWRYRDRIPQFGTSQPESAAMTRSATAGQP